MATLTVAALFVETGGVYYGLPDVDPWDIERDARLYRGPHPVVAHPPCQRWGRYWSGGPSAAVRRRLGDDDNCFASALWAVRTFGGVLEHPEASHAWSWFGLPRPDRNGGWTGGDRYEGTSCCVEQGHYGHKTRKATWLYAVRTTRPELRWGPSRRTLAIEMSPHSKEEARKWRAAPGYVPAKRLTPMELLATPIPFRDELLALARTASR